MQEVNVTEFRSHLPKYLAVAHKGTEISITSHGQVIARILPPNNTADEAIKQLKALRKNCRIVDVVSPIDEKWNAEK